MDEATGARLQAAREQRGVSPEEVAAAIGIPSEAVADIERGDALRQYGPGLAAAWTWAVGRHLGVAIDHELAMWEPPAPTDPGDAGARPEGSAGERPDAGVGERGDPGNEPGGDAGSEPIGEASDGPLGEDAAPTDAPRGGWREPTVAPGWLADDDHDPLAAIDEGASEATRGATPGEPSAQAAGDAADAANSDEPGAAANARDPISWAPPEDDLWGPEAAVGWPPTPDDHDDAAHIDQTGRPGDPEQPDHAGGLHAAEHPADGERDAATDEERDAAADQVLWAAPPDLDDAADADAPPAAAPPHDDAATAWAPDAVPDAGDETGELPAAWDDTRLLSFTEGDEAPPLDPPSRARTVGVVLVAMVLLVGAGIGVGALAARLLDAPGDGAVEEDAAALDEPGDGDARGEDEGEPAGEEPVEPGDGGDSVEGLGGDPDAAADPGDTTVQVLDGSADDARYGDALEVLEELGYRVLASGPAASAYEETTVFVTDGHADDGAALAAGDDRFAHQEPNDVGLSEDVELHVVVGEDWPDPAGG